MRAILLAGVAALGIGLLGTSGASAAPANGIVIDRSAAVVDQSVTQQVGWHGRWRSHWRWGSRGWRRGWWR